MILLAGLLGPLAALYWSPAPAKTVAAGSCGPGAYRDPVTGRTLARPDPCRPLVRSPAR